MVRIGCPTACETRAGGLPRTTTVRVGCAHERRLETLRMDYYEILGVPQEATPQEIKKAFRQIARECHPDVTGDDPVAAEKFKSARKAYETLIDPVTRSRYDRRGQR